MIVLKKIQPITLAFLLCFIFSCKANNSSEPITEKEKTVVDLYGQVKVKGNRIVDKNDSIVVLNGMSMFWSQWGGSFYNEQCIKWLRDDWKCTIIRAACAVEEGGYLTNPSAELAKVYTVIDACIKYGIYVIVDWHDHHAENHLAQSKTFFKTIAQKYGDQPNIIYEIYNEPLQNVSWANTVKPYADSVIKVIRQYDPDNLVVVGNPTWSQDVDVAANNPLSDKNVAYTLHFYTGTHTQSLRNKATTALNKGVAVFVSEFGISEASGSGAINYTETNTWMNFVATNKLSTCNWSLIDKDETSAALKPGANVNGNWTISNLSESGIFIRNRLITLNTPVFKAVENLGK